MRVSYIAPGASNFDDVFKAHHSGFSVKAGGLRDIKTLRPHNYYMRGGSLFRI